MPLPIASWPHALPTDEDQQEEPVSFLGRLLEKLKGARQEESPPDSIGWTLRGAKPGESWQESEARLKAYDHEHNRLLAAALLDATGERPADAAESSNRKPAAGRAIFVLEVTP